MSAPPWLELTAAADAPFAWCAGRPISRAEFARSAATLAAALPSAPFFINRCASRYRFALAFAAVALRDAVSLLPSAAGEGAIAAIQSQYPAALVLDDAGVQSLLNGSLRSFVRRDLCPATQSVAIAFTSGSTGEPQACVKAWRLLAMSAHYCRLQVGGGRGFNVVATVPPQHMFGLETTIATALAAGWAFFEGPSFFPAQIVAALDSLPRPRMLITSPFHLRHLLASGLRLPAVDVVLTATAPLTAELARAAENRCCALVQEIYGCSEAGSLATRRTAHDSHFTPYPDVVFSVHGERAAVTAAHMTDTVTLADRLDLRADGRFQLLGRDADMIKVAGRRASLADITRKLTSLPGVQDAVVFAPDGADNARPAALVVAPGQTEANLRAALARLLDPIFVPRPIRLVAALPRNALGKLPRAELLAMLAVSRD